VALRIGCDLVSLARVRERLEQGDSGFFERLFWPEEMAGQSLESLAGIYAAKEATCKALKWPPGRWLRIRVDHHADGEPIIALLGEDIPATGAIHLTISHEGDYALAFVVIESP
jgi:phosphopantetheine--protein transferase-like protein